MKRDMDLIRSLLIEIEDGQTRFTTLSEDDAVAIGADPGGALPKEEADKLYYHLRLIADAEFADFTVLSGGIWQVHRISWKGHEFLDNIRDPEVWRQTKAGAAKAGGYSLKMMASIAEAIIKSRIEKLLLGSLDS